MKDTYLGYLAAEKKGDKAEMERIRVALLKEDYPDDAGDFSLQCDPDDPRDFAVDSYGRP